MTSEYNLDFFEAMEALRQGKIVMNEEYPRSNYQLIDNKITRITHGDKNTDIYFIGEELTARWRIVEPEKCWLDNPQILTTCSSKCEAGAKQLVRCFAYEAIKRITADTSEMFKHKEGAIAILKDMIGEK